MSRDTSTVISIYLPRLGLSALILCLVSGVILTFYYRPVGNVFRNVEEITTLVPYGWFFRQFHFASGQLFVVLMLVHTVDHFIKKRYRLYSQGEWSLLIFSLGVCFFTLFTGFVLKGDKEGFFAAQIFMNIIKTLPLGGDRISRLFIREGDGFFLLPYLHHCFFLPALIVYALRGHIREWFPGRRFVIITGLGLFLFALLVRPGIDIPPDAQVQTVEGPWFFLGIQSLLRMVSPVWAGVIIPGALTAMLLVVPMAGGRWQLPARYAVMATWCSYGLITLRAAIWGP